MTALRPFRTMMVLVTGLAVCDVSNASAQDASSLNPIKAIDRATLKGFLERPLFNPTRRLPQVAPPPPPVVIEAPAPPPPAEPPPTLQLLGVIHGRRDMAIVHRDGGEKTIILRTGDRLGNWTVTVLPPIGVRLRRGNRDVNYVLFGKPGVGVGSVAADQDGRGDDTTEMSEAKRLQRRTE